MDLIRPWLAPYATVLFARDPWVGLALLLATATLPAVGLSGLLAVGLTLGIARVTRLPDEPVAEGLYSYNALLTGLAVGAWFPLGPAWAAALVVGALAATAGTAAARDLGTRSGLPVLTVPFLAVVLLLAAAAPTLGGPPPVAPPVTLGLPEGLEAPLRALGSLLFVPRPDAGLLVAAAILRWSRIGASLAALGAALGVALGAALGLDAGTTQALVLNLGLTAAALGGVWTVPSASSYTFAALGAGLAALVTLGGAPLAAALGLPLLILPFNLATLGLLLALRQRVEDRAPKSVDFLPGTPEENLRYFRTRVARFGARYGVRLRAPVRGAWEVTQAEGDGPTHQGAWRSALDLEVRGADGAWFHGDGTRAEDHHCWHLPVLACADGTVVKVVDGIRDNRVGDVDLDDNWGNVVVLWHGLGLHSLVAHLSPGRIEVVEGQRVRRGDVLGLCGSSGRSPRPHLHFQLQATAVIGAPTLPMELHDVVRLDGAPEVVGAWTPRTGDRLRNLAPVERSRAAEGWVPTRPFTLRVDGVDHEIVPEIDLYGRRVLRCGEGRLYFAVEDDLVTVLDTLAPRGSVLHLLHAALPRLPLELAPDAPEWIDHLPPDRPAAWLAPLVDLVEPFRASVGTGMRYRLRADGPDWLVEGASLRERDGAPESSTVARLRLATGLVEVACTRRGATTTATRIDPRRTP